MQLRCSFDSNNFGVVQALVPGSGGAAVGLPAVCLRGGGTECSRRRKPSRLALRTVALLPPRSCIRKGSYSTLPRSRKAAQDALTPARTPAPSSPNCGRTDLPDRGTPSASELTPLSRKSGAAEAHHLSVELIRPGRRGCAGSCRWPQSAARAGPRSAGPLAWRGGVERGQHS